MLISHKNKFIFIHIQKTAGTTVMDQFLPYCRLIDRMAYEFNFSRKLYGIIMRRMGWHDDGLKHFTGFHKHFMAYEAKEKIGSEIFDSYYKFAFVRNPFDLLVSLYFYLKQPKYNPKEAALDDRIGFKEFLKLYISNKRPRQIDFVSDPKNSEILVEYIGRYETLEADIANIKKNINISTQGTIKHMNPSVLRRSKDYKSEYDLESRKLVEDYFRADLDAFGYDFNGICGNLSATNDRSVIKISNYYKDCAPRIQT